MRRRMKIISMILIAGLMIGNINITKTYGAQNISRETPKVRIIFLNDCITETVKEPVFRIKNKSDSAIEVEKVEFQIKEDDVWVSAPEKEDANTDRNIKIARGESAYDSIVLRENYELPDKLQSGSYSVCVTYKYKGEYYSARKAFTIVNTEDSVTSDDDSGNVINKAPPIYPEGGMVNTTTAIEKTTTEDNAATVINGAKITGDADECFILNHDFSISKKGKVRATIFTEAGYSDTDKVKIKLKIQKKKGKKWKKVKKYKVTKKSSVAFLNKTFVLKKSGKYRMSVEVTFYKKGKKQGSYRVISKSQKYVKK